MKGKHLVDLTRTVRSGMLVYPGDPEVVLEKLVCCSQDGYTLTTISSGMHVGTHLDTPAHIFKNGETIEHVDLERMAGSGMVLDCSSCGEVIELEGLDEVVRGKRPQVILIYTGHGNKWGGPDYYDTYPYLSKRASHWLASLGVKMVGLDTPSPDAPHSRDLSGHRALLSKDILIVENLANLEKLLNQDFWFMSFALKLSGAEASPVRAVAWI